MPPSSPFLPLPAPSIPSPWLVEGLLPGTGVACLTSDGEARRRRLLTSMVGAALTGTPWLGRQVRPVSVTYILPRPKPRTEDMLPIGTSEAGEFQELSILKPIGLNLRGASSGLMSFLRAIDSHRGRNARSGQSPGLIIIDGLLAAMPGGIDQAQDVSELAIALRMMAMRLGALVLVSHDLAIDGTLVGHSRLAEAFDALITAKANAAGGGETLTLRGKGSGQALSLDQIPALSGVPSVEPGENDRRRYDRLPVSIAVEIETKGSPARACAIDISEDGMLVASLPLIFAPPGALLAARLEGIGVCSARVTARTGEDAHCQFAAMAPEARDALEMLLAAERAGVRDRVRAVQDVAWAIGLALDVAVAEGGLEPDHLFAPSYRRIVRDGQDTITASYQGPLKGIFAARLDSIEASRSDLTACTVLDRRAHPAYTRTKGRPKSLRRNDRILVNAARNCRPILVQRVQTGAGRTDLDISAPIRVMGHHWGCFAARFTEA